MQTFIYQHRRYQEFFFIQKLAKEYDNNPKVLRDSKILSNEDLFESFFLPYMRNQYEKSKNLPGVVELNLLDVYLGKKNDYGVLDIFELTSSDFVKAVAAQEEVLFEELLSNENLSIRDKITIDINAVKNDFERWIKNKDDYRIKDCLKRLWSKGVAFLLENRAILWQYKKCNLAQEVSQNLENLLNLFKNYNFLEAIQDEHIENPYLNQWHDFLYTKLTMDNVNSIEVLNNTVRINYEIYSSVIKARQELLVPFIEICINNKHGDLPYVIEALDNEELLLFWGVASRQNNLAKILSNNQIQKKLKILVQKFNNSQDTSVLFYKKILGVELNEHEKKYAENELIKLAQESNSHWRILEVYINYAKLSFVLKKNTFAELARPREKNSLYFYNELVLYAALFKSHVDLIYQQCNVKTIARDYIFYIENYDRRLGLYLENEVSVLWAQIFELSNQDDLLHIKNRLIRKDNNISVIKFWFELKTVNYELFTKLIQHDDLCLLEEYAKNWDNDYQSYVRNCYDLSIIFSRINKQKVISYLFKGVNEGKIRLGWRKDSLVSHLLVYALEILWQNKWEVKNKIKEYTKQVFDFGLRAEKITDDSWKGPYHVIELVSRYDLDFAIELKNELKKKDGAYSNRAVFAIQIEKAKLALPVEDIENEMKEYRLHSNVDVDYYEYKFLTYLAIAKNDLYMEAERKIAFEKACSQVEKMKELKIDFNLKNIELELKKDFISLCEKHSKKLTVDFGEMNPGKIPKVSEEDFIQEVTIATSKQKISALYRKLDDYNYGIVLSKKESWEILIRKTFEVYGNIEPFIELLKKNNYPHVNFYSSNSSGFHYGLASAINDNSTKREALDYLYDKSTGHGGFTNIMKVYEVNGDREMCVKLFERYIKFCDLLLN